jgi:YVTN family beta-propeller protein
MMSTNRAGARPHLQSRHTVMMSKRLNRVRNDELRKLESWMINRTVLALVATMAAALSGSAFAKGDAAVGQRKAVMCASCHGPSGISPTDAFPNLAGQGYTYLVTQLKAFRDGKRTAQLMNAMAKSLSDKDIEDFAAYFSTQKADAAAAPLAPASSAAPPVVPHPPIIASDIVVPRIHPVRQYWADKLPVGEGRNFVVQKCQLCHDLQRVIAFVRPQEQWQQVVEAMMRRGSPLTDEEKTAIVNYLTKYFGPESPPIPEVAIKPCTRSEWPKGSSDFRSNWKGSYNIWVLNQQGGNIDIVDPITKKILRRINCISSPDRAEFSRDGNTAYVPDRVEHNVTVIDTRTGAIKAKVPVVARPNTSVLSRDYKKLYMGIWPLTGDEDKRGYVQIVDTTALKVVKTIQTKGGIHDPWMSPDGKLLLAMSPPGRFMDVYDTQSDKLLYTCCTKAEIGTMNLEAGPDGSTSRIFFSYAGYPGIVVVDPKNGQELKRVPFPTNGNGQGVSGSESYMAGGPSGFHGGEISADGKNYWVTSGSIVHRYELPSLKPLGSVHLALIDQAGHSFRPAVEGSWLTISPDGQKVYAVRPGRNLLSVIDAKTMKEEALIPTGEYPLHISIWPRGTP